MLICPNSTDTIGIDITAIGALLLVLRIFDAVTVPVIGHVPDGLLPLEALASPFIGSWDHLAKAKARMIGLPVYLGNPISDHADRYLDLVGIGLLIALSHHESINPAAVMRYRMEFGRGNVFMIRSRLAEETPERLRLSAQAAGPLLFNPEQTYADLASRIELGNIIRTTGLTDQFTLEDLKAHHSPETILLYSIDPKGNIHLATDQKGIAPLPDWEITCLVPDKDAPIEHR